MQWAAIKQSVLRFFCLLLVKQQQHHSRTEGDIFYVSLPAALSVCCAAETWPAAGRRCKLRKVVFLEVTLYRLICEDSIWRVHINLPVQVKLPLYGVDGTCCDGVSVHGLQV